MAEPILRSLLDRLTDEPGGPGCSLEEFTRSVIQDLNFLVNTLQVNQTEIPESLTHVRTSLLSYGLPRPGLLGKSKEDRERLRLAIKETILRHEPRISKIEVKDVLAKEQDEAASLLPYAFKIIAELRTSPVPREVILGATLTRYPEGISITAGSPAGFDEAEDAY